jgi:signal transduction histidine kinase
VTTVCDPSRLLAAIPNGSVSIFDRELRYVYAAGKGLDDVGLSPEQLQGKRLGDVFPSDATAFVELEYRRAFGGESVVFGLNYFHRTYSLSAAPFLEKDGMVEQIIVVAQDITALAPAQPAGRSSGRADSLIRQRDNQDRLIATLGHELRNPLGAMRAAVAVIEHSTDRGTRERAREVIERQLLAADTLIQDLAELSRARRGVLRLKFADVCVDALLAEGKETLAHLATPGRHRINVRPAMPPGLRIRADGQRLLQVITNLLTNAIRYTPPDGEIVISAQQTTEGVSLAVSDSGRGISPEELDTIFDLFHRGDDADGHGGLGLGLWVAREIVLLHGGRIEVFSAGVGHGATFTVRLPPALVVGSAASRLPGTREGLPD